ncbi:glycosyl hydrolase, partial [Pseudomonadota bacterium]
FDNHKRGDYRPYVAKTSDRGKSWTLMVNGLPARGPTHTIVEDHVDAKLLFVGTEFGLFFSNDGAGKWQQLKDLPTISVRDLEIQRREGDLVVSTFGRGFYILDDYAPLRSSNKALESAAVLFPVRDSWIYIPDVRRGWGGKGDFGSDRYAADNPPYGAVIAYYLSEDMQSLKEQRRNIEQEQQEKGQDNPYPSWDQLRREDREEAPSISLIIRDSAGNIVRQLDGPAGKGFHRVAWDMRYPAPDPVNLEPQTELAPWESEPRGPLVLPGRYSVTLSKRTEGISEEIAGPQTFLLKPLFSGGLVADNREAVLEFQTRTAELYRAVMGADKAAEEIQARIDHLVVAVQQTPSATQQQATAVRALNARMQDLQVRLNGDLTLTGRQEPAPLSLTGRISAIVGGSWESQSAVTGNFRDSYAIAAEQFPPVLAELKAISAELTSLEAELEAEGAPWTPARLPEWPPR